MTKFFFHKCYVVIQVGRKLVECCLQHTPSQFVLFGFYLCEMDLLKPPQMRPSQVGLHVNEYKIMERLFYLQHRYESTLIYTSLLTQVGK